jgi:DNA-directed RNA polymerase specialized sigma24 family protein
MPDNVPIGSLLIDRCPGVGRRRSGPGARVTISPIHRRDDNDPQLLALPARDRRGRGALHNVLSALQEKYRRVLELWFLAGGSIEEASPVMAISVSNAKVIQRCVPGMTARLAQEAAR